MTTSYIREAQKKLKAEKKILREQEAKEQKAALEAAEKAHQENMSRIEKKMAKINGDVVEEVKPKKTTKKTRTKTTKKPAAKKRGRPKKS
jgi:DNA-binding protein H-NS